MPATPTALLSRLNDDIYAASESLMMRLDAKGNQVLHNLFKVRAGAVLEDTWGARDRVGLGLRFRSIIISVGRGGGGNWEEPLLSA